VDLTQLMAEEKGLNVDMVGFEAAMEGQKEQSRAARKTGGAGGIKMEAEATSTLAKMGISPTDDSHKYVWNQDVTSTVRAIMTPNGFVDSTAVRHLTHLLRERPHLLLPRELPSPKAGKDD
jgi:alanyl-tRNA synthetase